MSGSTPAEKTSRWARRFVLTSAAFLIAFAVADLLGEGRRTLVFLGLFGFVFHTVFGKAYSLLPAYFDRPLVTARGMPAHLVLTASGTVLLAVATTTVRPGRVESIAVVGAGAWAVGVAVFVGTILWTIRDNLAGAETGTGDVNADRRRVDRLANAVAPVALGYLAVGSYGVLAHYASLPGPFDSFPAVSHLLAAGTGALLVFGVGFRLLPRFLVVQVRAGTAAIVLIAGALGPLLLGLGLLGASGVLHAGAVSQAVAVLGFGAVYGHMFLRSDRRRVGFYGVFLGAVAGAVAVLLALDAALGRPVAGFGAIHFRLNVIGFLGLTIVGVTYQFYPPTAGTFRFAADRTAFVAIGAIGVGLLAQFAGVVADAGPVSIPDWAPLLGEAAVLLGALVHAGLLVALFRERYGSGH